MKNKEEKITLVEEKVNWSEIIIAFFVITGFGGLLVTGISTLGVHLATLLGLGFEVTLSPEVIKGIFLGSVFTMSIAGLFIIAATYKDYFTGEREREITIKRK